MIEAHAPAHLSAPALSGATLRRMLLLAASAIEWAEPAAVEPARQALGDDLRFFARAYCLALVFFLLLLV